jgi:hypothetical protein
MDDIQKKNMPTPSKEVGSHSLGDSGWFGAKPNPTVPAYKLPIPR